jgi:hypothetical protein
MHIYILDDVAAGTAYVAGTNRLLGCCYFYYFLRRSHLFFFLVFFPVFCSPMKQPRRARALDPDP